ncbi:NAD(P)H-dependent flavin oxidoreductase [Stigmatella aurantiaca]|uniref:Nitronate monooxygenase n=1 Tax=Stigmatella aurantiaca (strain DW4/3-1) TaxID=378806 RepID=Q08WD3_STIAD|nr:nitronate monooxygenase [Stigmatella aurantiaca]ADO69255.1 2-nitropropane dioxygenase NPD [Stigmatella aurantiaca DW4/3-1]EAU64796.1 2-nitropropane dioxygenase, NPD [Stigmatella aurantiaca DW4/3-1]
MTKANWPDGRIQELFGIALPLIQAPMAGVVTPQMVIAVSEAGGLGSLPCAMLSLDQTREALDIIRQGTSRPINLNFFCHRPPQTDAARELAWRARLAPYYVEQGLDPEAPVPASNRRPFDSAFCALVEEYKPQVVSFHFGLPEQAWLDRVKAAGAKVIASATTVAEARWLEAHGCDAIIAMGFEAGGHRGNFLTDDMATQVGTIALVPQVADAVKVPVIAAGGIADARGIVAAFALGASAVQMGTAYLFCPEARLAPPHLQALRTAADDGTAITNVFTGRPARGIVNRLMRDLGLMSPLAPAFPLAGGPLAPLRNPSAPAGPGDFMSLWSGQAARLGRELPAGELTQRLASEALAKLSRG